MQWIEPFLGIPSNKAIERKRGPPHLRLSRPAAVLRFKLTGLPLPGQEPEGVLAPHLLGLVDVRARVVGLEDLRPVDPLSDIRIEYGPRRARQLIEVVARRRITVRAQVLAVRTVDDMDV